ncbi:MAG: response regulator [Desulfovibrionaceae bacterium]|nr:response regulator [Desulfovibrionaceae bacterium]
MGESPYFQRDLYKRYYGASDAAKGLNLTRAEKNFIENAAPIRVGQLRNRHPFSFLDESSGTLSGINEDILALISQRTGLKFVAQPLALGEKPIDIINTPERFDMIMGVMDNILFRENPAIALSQPFFQSTLTVVKLKGAHYNPDAPYRVAVKAAFSALQDYLRTRSPQYILKLYTTDEDCMRAIFAGEADISMQNAYTFNYLLQKPQYSSLEMLPISFLTEKHCFMLSAKTSPTLLSILNKAIYSLPPSEVDKIVVANTTAKPYLLTWKDILYKYRVPFIAISLLLIICLLLFAKLLSSRQRYVRELCSKNAQLEDAVNQAQQANIAKSHFLTRMSHEIRTPMNTIVGLTVLAMHHKECTEKIKDYLRKIDSSAKILLSIINDVLDMSAIENEKLHIANAEFNLPQLLNNIASIYYTQCRNKGIDFIMGVDITEEVVLGDALRVNQVLMNLVSNAYKFTERGGKIEISVSQTESLENTVFMRFQVGDTGHGMSEDMLTRAFKPFEQESVLTAQKSGGSGLGLSITKNLVDMMHGVINVSSTLGEGTIFTVELPFGISPQNTTVDLQKIQHMRALVVDDDRDARLYTGVVLERIGICYDMAESGEEALRMIAEQHAHGNDYSVCFVDWKMPGMSGIELTRTIRNSFSDGKGGVIIVSAYDLSEIEEEAKAAGTDLLISKPLFQSSVFNALVQISDGLLHCPEQTSYAQYDFTGHCVLLAEDQPLNAEIATELLNMVHLKVDRAENGQQAVTRFVEAAPGTYDLILMDVQMPIMDGYEATRSIRALHRPDAATIPIVAMTADAFTADISLAFSSGMNGHIAKPIDTDLLYKTIHDAIIKNDNHADKTRG